MEENKNNELKNENGAGKKIIPVYFTTIPNILIQTEMLELLEWELAVLFCSFVSAGGCCYSRDRLKAKFHVGPYHLDRAIKRLQYRRMLRVVKGKKRKDIAEPRNETNRYLFERDPYKWKVTKEIQEKIIQQTLDLKMEPRPFEHDPFPNDIGFEISFEATFPKFAKGRKGRKKDKSTNEDPSVMIDWEMKSLELSSRSFNFFEIAKRYLESYDLIQVANSSDHKLKKAEAIYYKRIGQLFAQAYQGEISEKDLADYNNFDEAVKIHGENAKTILDYMIEKKNAG